MALRGDVQWAAAAAFHHRHPLDSLVVRCDDVVAEAVELVSAHTQQRPSRQVAAAARRGVVTVDDSEQNRAPRQMVGIDGFSLPKRIRSSLRHAAVPMMMVTALAMAGDEERARIAGVDDFITKPIDRRRVVRMVRERMVQR